MRIFTAPNGVSYQVFPGEESKLIAQGYKEYTGDAVATKPSPAAININSATAEEMVTALGLSIAIAKKIVAARPFADTQALAAIQGVNLAAIASKITV